jgi:exopolysaccharide biosynthesis polyprenyl glycosylphosphotransferase
LSSSLRLPSINQFRLSSYSKRILESREWVRLLAVSGAVTVDAALLLISALMATVLRYGDLASGNSTVLLLMMLPAYLFASVTYKAYSLDTLKQGGRSSARAILALLTAAAFAFAAAFALHVSSRFSRLETGYVFIIGALLLTVGRSFGARLLDSVRFAIETSTFVLGDETAQMHGRSAERVINIRRLNWAPSAEDPDFLDVVCRTFRHADRVVLVFADPRERIAWASFMRLTGINTELLEPQLQHVVPSGIGHWAGSPTLVVSRGPLSLPERVVKRLIDLAFVLLIAPGVVPVLGVFAILVKWESPGPCLFSQDRVGRKNGRYRCYKLRTMRFDATDPNGDQSASRDDERITPLGRFLRRTSLDELPQLWNVLIGDMSLVGPRPHALGSTAEGALFWHAVNGYWIRHSMKPGLTGLAQVRGFRGATHSLRDIEKRVSADLEYVNSWSLWLDFKILLKTPLVMVHRNAF